MRAMNSNTQPQRVEAPGPSAAERFVLESCAAQAAALGRTLADSRQLRLEGCAPLDLASATTLEFLLLGPDRGQQHLQRGDDLLRLIERAGAILEAARGGRPAGGKTDAGLHLLRGIAMAELLHEESRGRFASARRLGRARRFDDGDPRRRLYRALRRCATGGGAKGVSRLRGGGARGLAPGPGAPRCCSG